ncbi:MAG: hypothetical protein WD098_03260 [Balneolales bacterium]
MADVKLDNVKRTLYRMYVSMSGTDNSDRSMAKLSAIISEVSDSFTMISAIGNDQRQFEESTIIEIAVPDQDEKLVFAVAEIVRDRFDLDAVGICKVGEYLRVVKK